MLSEEDADVSLEKRSNWHRYWLVDPLDGTQEFIARSGDFATIIALVEDHRPVMGVVYSPVSGVTYYAYKNKGAWKIPDMDESMRINTLHHEGQADSIAMAISRRQDISRITSRMNSRWNYDLVPLGSAALKACLVAEGAVDCYLRLGPTGEWDTAATQCIVEEAGGRILSTQLEPLSYNERETLENPNFIVLGDQSLPWDEILQVKTDLYCLKHHGLRLGVDISLAKPAFNNCTCLFLGSYHEYDAQRAELRELSADLSLNLRF